MEIGSHLVADPQEFELVEPGEGPLDDPPGPTQAGSVGVALACDLRRDAANAEEPPVFVVVVAAVGEQPPWSVTWPARQATDAGYRVEQGHELGDVVTVSAGHRHRKGGSVRVGDHMVLAAPAAAVDRRRSGVSPPFKARTCEPSIAESSMSSGLAEFREGDLVQTGPDADLGPVPQAPPDVTPLQLIVSAGTSAQVTPVRRT